MSIQRLSTWCALRCREEAFQRFLGVDSEPAAAQKVRTLCGVTSRSEFDRDPEAAERLHQLIRIPFCNFIHDQEAATCSSSTNKT